MVILWTNLEGERNEPSATASTTNNGTNVRGGEKSKKSSNKVAVKPELPPLYLPLIKSADSFLAPSPGRSSLGFEGSNNSPISPYSPYSSNSHECCNDDLRMRMLLFPHDEDLSPDSGLSQCDPTPTATPGAPKKFPIVYGNLFIS